MVKNVCDAETKALCVLTYFNLPAKAEHVAPIANLSEEETAFTLRNLANRSLSVLNDELKTFATVPLISDFLRKKMPEVIAEIGDRLADIAFALVIKNGYKQYDRFPILDAAWPRLAPALPIFLAGSNDRLQVVCTNLHLFFEFTGRWDEWLSFFEKAEAKAVSAGDYANAGWRAYEVGWVHKLRMEADAVVACAERASRHWDIAKANARDRAFAVRLRGMGYMLKEDYSAAAASYRDSLAIHRSFSPESEDVAIALADLGAIEHHSGDLPAAERTYREALRVARVVNYTEGVVFVMGNLAELALTANDWSSAEAFASQALPLAEKLGRQELIASNCCRLAAALAANGKEAEGLPYARRALEIYTSLDSPHVGYARAVTQICEG
jgi:tetratricopeptide (TPR) repeat protein